MQVEPPACRAPPALLLHSLDRRQDVRVYPNTFEGLDEVNQARPVHGNMLPGPRPSYGRLRPFPSPYISPGAGAGTEFAFVGTALERKW